MKDCESLFWAGVGGRERILRNTEKFTFPIFSHRICMHIILKSLFTIKNLHSAQMPSTYCMLLLSLVVGHSVVSDSL